MGIPDHLTCLLRNLYQEATVRTRHGKMDWFKIEKGVHQACSSMSSLSSPCLFNIYAEYIMLNARLDESQVGIRVAGRNISFNLKYVDDATPMTVVVKELQNLIRVKEESEKAGLELSIQRLRRPWHPVSSLYGQ